MNIDKFSLIQVSSEKDGKINGWWVQDHVGTLETAKKAAEETEKANDDKIEVAIVSQLNTTTPLLDGIFTDLDRLDKSINKNILSKILLLVLISSSAIGQSCKDFSVGDTIVLKQSCFEGLVVTDRKEAEGYNLVMLQIQLPNKHKYWLSEGSLNNYPGCRKRKKQ